MGIAMARAAFESTDLAHLEFLQSCCSNGTDSLAPFMAVASRSVMSWRKAQWTRPTEAQKIELALLSDQAGYFFSKVGDGVEAAAATAQAVCYYQGLAAEDPDSYKPYLARALTNLGNRLWTSGRKEDALSASRAAVNQFRMLAISPPGALGPTGTRVGNRPRYDSMRRSLPARELKTASDAVAYFRRKAKTQKLAHRPHLAAALWNQGMILSAFDRTAQAVEAFEEAAPIKLRGFFFPVATEEKGCPRRGETVCPFDVLQPRRGFPFCGV